MRREQVRDLLPYTVVMSGNLHFNAVRHCVANNPSENGKPFLLLLVEIYLFLSSKINDIQEKLLSALLSLFSPVFDVLFATMSLPLLRIVHVTSYRIVRHEFKAFDELLVAVLWRSFDH